MGGHAVKLIGWGTSDAGEDYWVCCFFFFFCRGYAVGSPYYYVHCQTMRPVPKLVEHRLGCKFLANT